MKRTLLKLIVFCLIGLSCEAITQEFTVQGSKIIGPDGKEFVAKGINVNGPHWPWKRSTVDDVDLIADVWKFNSVRVNCFPRLDFIKTNLDLDAIVDAFTQKKVVSMLEVHDYTGTYPGIKDDFPSLEELTEWWIDKAKRYKDNPYVWFNIMNEPGGNKPVPELWKTTHESVIKAIRATGAKNIIVLDGHHFGQEGGFKDPEWSGILKYGPYFAENYNNIVFSLHLYSLWSEKEDVLYEYVNKVHQKNLPLIFGEFGEASRYDQSATSAAFKVAVEKKIGRLAWHWTSENNAGNDLTKNTSIGGGWEIDKKDGSKPTNLNWMGNIIWDDNHNQLNFSSMELEGPPLMNGGFENGLHGWQNYGKAELISEKNKVKTGSKALGIPNGRTGGGTSQLLLLEPASKYKLRVLAMHNSKPAESSVVSIRYKNEEGKIKSVSLSFNETEFVEKSIDFETGEQVVSPDLFFHKADTSVWLYLDDIGIEIMN